MGNEMLVQAIGKTHVDYVKASIAQSASDARPVELAFALTTAAMIGDTTALEKLLEGGADVNAWDRTGRTALIEAVFGGHKDAVELLLERGAEVNGRDTDGWTPLMEGASKGRTEIVRTLLAHGAKVDVASSSGCTAIKVTVRSNAELVTLLREAGESQKTIKIAQT
jgi:hypothetical protein